MPPALILKKWTTKVGLEGYIFVTRSNHLELTVAVDKTNEFWGKSPLSKLGEELSVDLCAGIMSALDPRWQKEHVWHVGYRVQEALKLEDAIKTVEDLAFDVDRLGAKVEEHEHQ